MIQSITLTILTLIGAYKFPVFTLGCVLIHYNHPVLGIVIIIYSLLKERDNDDEIEYID